MKVPEWAPLCYMVASFMRSAVIEAFDTGEMGSRVMASLRPELTDVVCLTGHREAFPDGWRHAERL